MGIINFCPNCGQPVREGERFCSNCGIPIYEKSEDTATNPEGQAMAPGITVDELLAQRDTSIEW